MFKIIAPYLFSWKDADQLGGSERPRLVPDNFPDDCLIDRLVKERGKGRKPIRGCTNVEVELGRSCL